MISICKEELYLSCLMICIYIYIYIYYVIPPHYTRNIVLSNPRSFQKNKYKSYESSLLNIFWNKNFFSKKIKIENVFISPIKKTRPISFTWSTIKQLTQNCNYKYDHSSLWHDQGNGIKLYYGSITFFLILTVFCIVQNLFPSIYYKDL